MGLWQLGKTASVPFRLNTIPLKAGVKKPVFFYFIKNRQKHLTFTKFFYMV